MTTRLASAAVTSRQSGIRGRAIVSAKARHFIVDAPLMLGGPNEEVNPIDLFLSSLAGQVLFIIEKIAQQQHINLSEIAVTVIADYDPRGVVGQPVDPSLRNVRIRMGMEGPTDEEALALIEHYKQRCPIYVTLARAVPIEVELVYSRVNVG